jgi:outer membrane protein OmpA-like peptidoglycan-associated protein
MKKSLVAIAVVALTGAGSAACATKGFVNNQVGQVSSKVDTLSQSLEATQERTRQNEARIGEVDQRVGVVATSAERANSAATAADAKAAAAAEAARSVGEKADARATEIEKATRRIMYEVTLSENQGNFTFGKAVLPDAAKARIDELVNQIKADPKGSYFEIEGHTDNVGDAMYNHQLGLERAEAVKKYLYEQHQIPLHRMNVVSYGEDKPEVENKTRDGRASNRRVVLRILS